MLKSKKLSLVIALMFVFTICFSQIARADSKVVIPNNSNIKTLQSKVNLTIKLNTANLSQEEQQTFMQLMPILNNMNMSFDIKSVQGDNAVKTDNYINMIITLMGTPLNMEMWAKTDLANGQPNFTEIIKLPKELPLSSLGLPADQAQKEYLVIDSNSLSDTSNSAGTQVNLDYNKIMEPTKKFAEVITKYAAGFDSSKYITDKGNVTVTTPEGTVNAHEYEVKFTDASFKEFIKYIVSDFAQNKEVMDALKVYLQEVGSATGSSSADIEKAISDITNNMPAFITEFNKIMDTFKDVKLLGDRGLVLDYAVSAEGYTVSEKGTIDLVIDVPALEKALNSLDPASQSTASSYTGVYTIGLDFDSVNYNINKDVKVEYPSINSSNSINLAELITSLSNTQTNTTAPKPTTPAKKPTTPAKKPAAPAKKATTPAKKVTTPAKKVTTPAKKVTTPAKKLTTPAKKTTVKKPVKKTTPKKTTSKKTSSKSTKKH